MTDKQSTTIQELMEQSEVIRSGYEELSARNGRDAWRIRDYAMGLVGDVGDLMKVIMTKENLRNDPDADAKLGSELADVLNGILILASNYGIDLEQELINKQNKIVDKIAEKNT